MSVTIADILKLPSMHEAKVVAGHSGMNKTISSISVLEFDDPKLLSADAYGHTKFVESEIIISAFTFFKDDVDEQCAAIERMHNEGEIGIILFYVGCILPSIDRRLLEMADKLSMPLIIMPERRLDLRYSDVICEVMEAVVRDREQNTYFATEVIERLSHIEPPQRNINVVLAAIRDRVHCSIFVLDEMDKVLNSAEWPYKRGLPINDILAELDWQKGERDEIAVLNINGKNYYIAWDTIKNNDTNLYAVIIKEQEDLTEDCCQQIVYILKTYINLWTENYGKMDTKQLINAIINDEPEKTRQIASILNINIKNLSSVYFFYNRDFSQHDYARLRKARQMIQDFLLVYRNSFLTDTFDEAVITFADRQKEKIDKDLPLLFDELAKEGLDFAVVSAQSIATTKAVKEYYWAFQNNKKYIPIVFPQKRAVTMSEMNFVLKAKALYDMGDDRELFDKGLVEELFTQKRELDLINTAEVYLLDADMDMSKTAELMFVHKNTIKYRLKSLEKLFGCSLSRMPEAYELYMAAALSRLRKALS